MTPIAELRQHLGLSQADFALILGYRGKALARSVIISRFESGSRPIPPAIARLAAMYSRFGVPPELRPIP